MASSAPALDLEIPNMIAIIFILSRWKEWPPLHWNYPSPYFLIEFFSNKHEVKNHLLHTTSRKRNRKKKKERKSGFHHNKIMVLILLNFGLMWIWKVSSFPSLFFYPLGFLHSVIRYVFLSEEKAHL